MKLRTKITCALAISCLGVTAHAGTFSCSGQVSFFALSPAGLLEVSNGYGVHYLCTVTGTYSTGIAPDTCKAWYALFLTAKSAGTTVTEQYQSAGGTAQTCQDLLNNYNWAIPNPVPYIVIAD